MIWRMVKESYDNGDYCVRYEYDALEHAMEVLEARHAEMGDRAFEVALADIGYVKQRTCRIITTRADSDYVDDWRYRCSECRCNIPVDERIRATGEIISAANFCPNCGAKVVE